MNTYDLTPIEGTPAFGRYHWLVDDLIHAPVIHTGEWQAIDTTGSKAHGTHELEDVTIIFDPIPQDMDNIVPAIDHSWADDHYFERVGGTALNPCPSHLKWPYAVRNNGDHTNGQGHYDHTYPERFWPKFANEGQKRPNGRQVYVPHNGVRFEYGDLNSLVDLLVRSPMTRQAFLPVWFPEDTGAVHGQRVPCTLGYHFMIRNNTLSCRYYMRSCDIYRHFSNDVYLAGMLMRWVTKEVNLRKAAMFAPDGETPLLEYAPDRPLRTGKMIMHIASLHAFVGDHKAINARLAKLP